MAWTRVRGEGEMPTSDSATGSSFHLHANGCRVSGEAFCISQQSGFGAESTQSPLRVFLNCDEFYEIVHTQTASHACHASGRQRVVGSGDVVAQRLRRPTTHEH